LAAIYRREEPDALMSARPGPSGGYPVRGIPTGSDSYRAEADHRQQGSRLWLSSV